jgi:spore coat protein H
MKINHLWMPFAVIMLAAAALSLFWYGKTAAGQTIYETAESIDYSEFVDYENVVTMYMTVSSGNSDEHTHLTWDEVNSVPISFYEENEMDVYYGSEAIIQVGDENGLNQKSFGAGINVPNAVVTLRGANASIKPQKSYRIEFKTFADNWNDQNVIYLNKYIEDGVRFRTVLAQKLADEIPGLTALDTTFVHLYVKDKTVEGEDVFVDYGLYTQIERPDSDFLKRVGLDMNGELYKAENFDFSRHEEAIMMSSDPNFSLETFENYIENKGDTDDNTDLIAMLDAVNSPNPDIEAIIAKYFDEENYYSFLALQILLGNTPEATRDFLLYSPSDSEKFYFLMWDADHILYNAEEEILNRKYEIRAESIAMMTGVLPFYKNKLHKMVLTNKNCVEKLTAKMDELTDPVYENIRNTSARYSEMIKALCFSQPDIMNLPLSPENYDMIAGHLNNEFIENRNRFKDDIEKPSPFSVNDISVSANGENLVIDWEDALDTANEQITYDVTIALRYTLLQDIYTEEDLNESRLETDMLDPGQYFISIVASDSKGNERKLYSYYENIFDERYAGILCFYINPDGTVAWQGL